MPWLHLLSKFDSFWMISFCSCISFSTDKCFWGKVEFVPFAIAEQSKSSQVARVLIFWRKAGCCLFCLLTEAFIGPSRRSFCRSRRLEFTSSPITSSNSSPPRFPRKRTQPVPLIGEKKFQPPPCFFSAWMQRPSTK